LNLFSLIRKKSSVVLQPINKIFFLLVGCCFLSFKPVCKSLIKPAPYHHSLLNKSIGNSILDILFRDDSSSCVIPFNRVGNLILIQAKADSIEGNFILDTGSPYLVLNIVYFRNYPVTSIADEHQTSVSGVAEQVEKTTVKEFSFGSLRYYWEKADLLDLGHIENSKGVKILGLIGLSLIQQCEIIIDYTQSLIYMHRIGKKESKTYKSEQLKNESAYTTIPITIEDRKIIAKTEMAGKKLQFILDSGSETNILDSRLSEKVFEHVDITGRLNIRGTGNSMVEALQGNLKGMKMGSEDMGTMPVLIANLEKTCFSVNFCISGVLGLEFLPLQKIGFNFVTRKMYLWK
jgi:hypothetical protein